MTKAKIRKRYPRALRRAERRSALNAPGFVTALTSPSLAGILVTPQTALTFSAVYAAHRVITEDCASLPLEVFRRRPDGGREAQTGHDVHRLLTVSPDGETTDLNWRESWHAHCLGWGNGYAEIEQTKGGKPKYLHLLHPSTTEPKRDGTGGLIYELTDTKQSIPGRRVLHLAGLGFNGLKGYSPIALHREGIGLGKAAEEFGATFFGNGAVPKGLLKHPTRLKGEALANLRDSVNSVHQGSKNSHKFMILEEGMDWVNTQIAPEEAQFLATRQFQVVEIARIYRIPPHKLGDYSQSHLANVEAANLDYLITCLRPWLVRIEKVLNFKLFSEAEQKAGFYVKHDMRALLRGDAKSRGEYYTRLRDLGVLTVDDILELEDMNPIGPDAGGSKRLVPLNMTTLDSAGQAPEPTPTASNPEVPTDGN